MKKKDLWQEFVHPAGLCGLCGNRGVIDTTKAKLTSPAGTLCGVRRYCICPNGRGMRKANGHPKWGKIFEASK